MKNMVLYNMLFAFVKYKQKMFIYFEFNLKKGLIVSILPVRIKFSWYQIFGKKNLW